MYYNTLSLYYGLEFTQNLHFHDIGIIYKKTCVLSKLWQRELPLDASSVEVSHSPRFRVFLTILIIVGLLLKDFPCGTWTVGRLMVSHFVLDFLLQAMDWISTIVHSAIALNFVLWHSFDGPPNQWALQ